MRHKDGCDQNLSSFFPRANSELRKGIGLREGLCRCQAAKPPWCGLVGMSPLTPSAQKWRQIDCLPGGSYHAPIPYFIWESMRVYNVENVQKSVLFICVVNDRNLFLPTGTGYLVVV